MYRGNQALVLGQTNSPSSFRTIWLVWLNALRTRTRYLFPTHVAAGVTIYIHHLTPFTTTFFTSLVDFP